MQRDQLREYLELVRHSGSWVAHRDLLPDGCGLLHTDSQDLLSTYQAAVVKVRAAITD